jgi:hypothetical protein
MRRPNRWLLITRADAPISLMTVRICDRSSLFDVKGTPENMTVVHADEYSAVCLGARKADIVVTDVSLHEPKTLLYKASTFKLSRSIAVLI